MNKNNLSILRKRNDITAQELAEKLGISRAYLYDLEKFEEIPSKYEEELIKIFNCEKRDLYLNSSVLCSKLLPTDTIDLKNDKFNLKYFDEDLQKYDLLEILQKENYNIEVDLSLIKYFAPTVKAEGKETLLLFPVKTNRLAPYLNEGDITTVDYSIQSITTLKEIFLIQSKNKNQFFALLTEEGSDGNIYMAQSLAEKPTIIHNLEDVSFDIIGKVVKNNKKINDVLDWKIEISKI